MRSADIARDSIRTNDARDKIDFMTTQQPTTESAPIQVVKVDGIVTWIFFGVLAGNVASFLVIAMLWAMFGKAF